ncbi:MAG: LuxR C-terminal-related transcriptional regulator [Pseudomonadota bacterium]
MRFEDRLIQLAYELVLEPTKLFELDDLLDQKISRLIEAGNDVLTEPDKTLQDVSHYYESALALAERTEHSATPKARRAIRSEALSWVMVNDQGVITKLSEAAQQNLGLSAGEHLHKALSDTDDKQAFCKGLAGLRNASPEPALVLTVLSAATERLSQHIVEWDLHDPDGPVAIVQELNMSWEDSVGRLFSQSLSLTAAELAICRAIVNGVSLRDLAQQRARSLGTVRNQLKHLLSKLNLKSQTELVCLYSGFSKLSKLNPDDPQRPFGEEGRRKLEVLELADGSHLAVDVWGDPDARPVLYLHPMIGGTGLTPEVKALFKDNGYRLIMPWRPQFGSTSGCGTGFEQAYGYAQRLAELLDHFDVAACPVIASHGASPYAFAFAQTYPDRCEGLVFACTTLPIVGGNQLKKMIAQVRVPYYLAKHAPSVLRFYLRSIVAKVHAGYEDSYVNRFYSGSLADLDTISDAVFKKMIFDSMTYGYLNGVDGGVQEILLNAMDWSSLVAEITQPVHLVYGEQDVRDRTQLIEDFLKTMPTARLEIVSGAGSLVFYQRPDVFVQQLQELNCSAAA